MTDLVPKVLDIFKEQNITEGGALHKSVVLDAMKSWGADINSIRDAWHRLMGEGLIQQVGENIVLTSRGAAKIY